MPWTPQELPVFVIENAESGQITKDMIVRRELVERWLMWLKLNSPLKKYQNIKIYNSRLASLPENGPLKGLRSIDREPETTTLFRDTDTSNEEEHVKDNDGNPASNSLCSIPPTEIPTESSQRERILEHLINGIFKFQLIFLLDFKISIQKIWLIIVCML